jgi:mRNA interferase MazF
LVNQYCPGSGDLVWLDFDPQAGHEQASHRPALVLFPKAFNQRTSLAYVCPITSKIKGFSTEVLLADELPVHGAVLCAHMRSLDWRIRNAVLIGKVPDKILEEVREIVGAIAGIAS